MDAPLVPALKENPFELQVIETAVLPSQVMLVQL